MTSTLKCKICGMDLMDIAKDVFRDDRLRTMLVIQNSTILCGQPSCVQIYSVGQRVIERSVRDRAV